MSESLYQRVMSGISKLKESSQFHWVRRRVTRGAAFRRFRVEGSLKGLWRGVGNIQSVQNTISFPVVSPESRPLL
jgi:hypothetical protein